MSRKINVLELNNLDIYGKRFNGYSIAKYAKLKSQKFNIKLLVNHKLGNDDFVLPLFNNKLIETADWRIDELENKLETKNQISLSATALLNHPAYQEADILHFHMYHNMHLPIEFLTQIPPEKKIILDLHDTFWLTDHKIPMLEVFKASNSNKTSLDAQRKRVLHDIDAELIVHSSYMLNLLKKSDATKDLHANLIKFGVNLDIFKPLKNTSSLRQKYHIPKSDVVLLFRTQKEFKGIYYIIKALKSLQTNHNITLLTVGAETHLIDSLSSKYNIIELGLINNESEMAEIYNLSDIFLAPSTEESFGFMAAEAMACKKPVIVFEGTALPDTVNAPLVGISTPRNATALAQAIKTLIENPKERVARGKKSFDFATKEYDELNYLKNNLDLYKKLTTKKYRKINQNRTNTATPYNCLPKNLLAKTQKFLTGKKISLAPLSLNYNNPNVQKTISNFNEKLYYNIKNNQTFFIKIRNNTKLRKIIKKIIGKSS